MHKRRSFANKLVTFEKGSMRKLFIVFVFMIALKMTRCWFVSEPLRSKGRIEGARDRGPLACILFENWKISLYLSNWKSHFYIFSESHYHFCIRLSSSPQVRTDKVSKVPEKLPKCPKNGTKNLFQHLSYRFGQMKGGIENKPNEPEFKMKVWKAVMTPF